LSSGMYSKLSRTYYTKWKTRLYLEDLVFEHEFNLENSRVFIVFESSSLGDTIAWMPYCEEFRKKHNCHVIVSSFRNDMFKNLYPEIEFVERGAVVPNLKALYRLGWFYDKDKEPVLPSTIPLQKSTTNILGLDYKEIHSKIYFEPKKRPYPEKYICIAPSSTAGCKLWNNPTGWLELTKYLSNKGYKVINISKDGEQIEGVENINDDSMENTKNVIFHSEFVIGLSSGLSWLSWALDKHVVMISNFTDADHEFTINCTRITNPLVCNGCWNNPKFKFDKGDWYWCPEHKGTERQFECHKSITADMVINQIQHLL
jgi:autotransporter strand-loop-strand O-heptosyltransferase